MCRTRPTRPTLIQVGTMKTLVTGYLQRARLKKLTKLTQIDRVKLRHSIDEARKVGHSIVVDELAYGVSAIAVPIKNRYGETIAALNSSGYTGRLTVKAMLNTRLPELRLSSARLTKAISNSAALHYSLSPPNG